MSLEMGSVETSRSNAESEASYVVLSQMDFVLLELSHL
jgi:hypothetical protein